MSAIVDRNPVEHVVVPGRQVAGMTDAVYGLAALATAARVVWPCDVVALHHALFETSGGQAALEQIERGLGLAIVPVEMVR